MIRMYWRSNISAVLRTMRATRKNIWCSINLPARLVSSRRYLWGGKYKARILDNWMYSSKESIDHARTSQSLLSFSKAWVFARYRCPLSSEWNFTTRSQVQVCAMLTTARLVTLVDFVKSFWVKQNNAAGTRVAQYARPCARMLVAKSHFPSAWVAVAYTRNDVAYSTKPCSLLHELTLLKELLDIVKKTVTGASAIQAVCTHRTANGWPLWLQLGQKHGNGF